jgi:hypothetical protein
VRWHYVVTRIAAQGNFNCAFDSPVFQKKTKQKSIPTPASGSQLRIVMEHHQKSRFTMNKG